MTANPKPQPQKPLRVVHPKARTPEPLPQKTQLPETEDPSNNLAPEVTSPEPESGSVWMRRVLIAAGFAAAAFIPTPYWVGGEVTLESTQGQRQAVYAPRRAMVQEIHVEAGATISEDEPLVTLSSLELEREITDTEEKLTQARSVLERLQVQQVELDTELQEATILAQTAKMQANRLQNRVTQLETGSPPPELEALEVRANRLQERLEEQQLDIDNYQTLFEAGAVAEKVVRDAESAYRETEKELTVVREEIELASRQLIESTEDRAYDAAYQAVVQQSASKIAETNADIQAHEEMIQVLQESLENLRAQQTSLTVYSTLSGRVLGEDLDLALGQEMEPNQVILRVVNLKELTAQVEVQEDDLVFVNVGAPLKFRSQQSKLDVYKAHVEEIPSYDVEADETRQRRVVTVEISIENEDEQLRPGSSGYAKIFSEWIPLYERIGREISKLVPIRFL